MSILTLTYVIIFFFCLGTSFLGIFASLYIHLKYRCYIERQLWGHSFVDMGFLFNSYQLMGHAHYLIFPKSAERKNVAHVYQNLPPPLRKALLIVYFSMSISVVLMIIGYVIMEYVEQM